MLKAVVIYLPGSAGSFLYRVLTLSERTACADSSAGLNYNIAVDELTRLNNYNNWTKNNWKHGEGQWGHAYKAGLIDFNQLELTDNWVIDLWHPVEFLDHDTNGIAWVPGAWPCYIFITVSIDHKEFLLRNRRTKQYHLDWDSEMSAYDTLRLQYRDKIIDIDFDAFFDEDLFVDAVRTLDQPLELNLNFDNVRRLWQGWYKESQQVWI